MDIKKERKAFAEHVSVSLDRILMIQNGIADQYAELFKKYTDNNANKAVIQHHLTEAREHLANINNTYSLIDNLSNDDWRKPNDT